MAHVNPDSYGALDERYLCTLFSLLAFRFLVTGVFFGAKGHFCGVWCPSCLIWCHPHVFVQNVLSWCGKKIARGTSQSHRCWSFHWGIKGITWASGSRAGRSLVSVVTYFITLWHFVLTARGRTSRNGSLGSSSSRLRTSTLISRTTSRVSPTQASREFCVLIFTWLQKNFPKFRIIWHCLSRQIATAKSSLPHCLALVCETHARLFFRFQGLTHAHV